MVVNHTFPVLMLSICSLLVDFGTAVVEASVCPSAQVEAMDKLVNLTDTLKQEKKDETQKVCKHTMSEIPKVLPRASAAFLTDVHCNPSTDPDEVPG